MQCAFGLVLAVGSRIRQGSWRNLRLPFRGSDPTRMGIAAVLAALVVSPFALAQELENIRITSNPGSDDTYSSDGEDSTIVFEAEWALRVSVRGANLVFIMGDEEREAFCPQTGDCDTCPRGPLRMLIRGAARGSGRRRHLHTGGCPLQGQHHAQQLQHQPGVLHRRNQPGMHVPRPAGPGRAQGGRRRRRTLRAGAHGTRSAGPGRHRRPHRAHRLDAARHRPAADRHHRRRRRRGLLPHRPRRQRHRDRRNRRPHRHERRAARRQRRADLLRRRLRPRRRQFQHDGSPRSRRVLRRRLRRRGRLRPHRAARRRRRPGRHRSELEPCSPSMARQRCRASPPSAPAPCSPPSAPSTRP